MVDNQSYDKIIREIKHDFMIYRNGIVADTLRKGGIGHNIIFGVQLPVITTIAQNLSTQLSPEEMKELANRLWQDEGVRESRLLACRVYPPQLINFETALRMCREIKSVEEADILAFGLLRHTPWLEKIHVEIDKDDDCSIYKKPILRAIARFSCNHNI